MLSYSKQEAVELDRFFYLIAVFCRVPERDMPNRVIPRLNRLFLARKTRISLSSFVKSGILPRPKDNPSPF